MNSLLFRQIFDSTRCGILTIDEAGRVTTLNQVGMQILDVGEVPPQGVPCQELLADHASLCRLLLDSLRMENPPTRIELDLRVPGHPRRVIGGTVSHVRGPDGERNGAVLFFKDLTHIEEHEEQERLKDRLAALGQMAAGLAHEIRNPLANIGSTATLLKTKLDGNDSGVLALDSIVQQVRRLNQAVTQCLEYAKPVNIRPRPVDVQALVGEALREVSAKWPAGRVEIRQNLDPRMTGLHADGTQLRQVLHNLIANAYDAMGGEGVLEIDAFLEPERAMQLPTGEEAGTESQFSDYAVIRIRDHGRGITPEARGRLFFPFFTTKPGGSGIGLAVAKKIVDSHGGIIDVESEPGRGATFFVKLPYPGAPEHPAGRS